MARREALRELQSRLANRLQAAREQGQAAAWLAIECEKLRFLIPLTQAGEIFAFSPIQPVPYTANWFLGVTNLRGGLCGVVDLSMWLGQGPTLASERAAADANLVLFNPALEINCAVLAGRLVGLRGVESFVASSEAPPQSPDCFGHQYTDSQDVAWQEINLQRLAQSPQFLGIGA